MTTNPTQQDIFEDMLTGISADMVAFEETTPEGEKPVKRPFLFNKLLRKAYEQGRRAKGSSWREGYERGLEEQRENTRKQLAEIEINEFSHTSDIERKGDDYCRGAQAALMFVRKTLTPNYE